MKKCNNYPQLSIDNLIDQMPGFFLWKDINSVFIGANNATAKLFGYQSPEHLIGTTDYDIKCDAAKFADISVKQDEKLKLYQEPLTILDIRPYINGEIKVLLINKSLTKNSLGVVNGIACQCLEIKNTVLKQIGIYLYDQACNKRSLSGSYYLNHDFQNLKLSDRQSECLFYLLRGKTAARIAEILKISRRTVESYIEEIKNKMNCDKKSQIIEKAVALGLHETIPPGILKDILF